MQVLCVCAEDEGTVATLTDRLVAALDERGRVGVVRSASGSGDTPRQTTVELTDDGWTASGPDGSLDDALDRLVTDHDYAVVSGFPDARLPQVTIGAVETATDPVYAAGRIDDADVETLVECLEATEPYETLESLVARVKRSPDAEYAGAISTFTGRVRAREEPEDTYTEALEFEKYEGVAEARLDAIREQLEARDGVYTVLLHHRTGVIEYGEDIVFVVVLAGHRAEAFSTVRDGINRLKAEVPLFKKEITVEDDFWVHERP